MRHSKPRGKKPFKSPQERFVKEKNPKMVYADKSGYDFMIARKKIVPNKKPYIKVEVKKTTPGEKIRFEITNGIWRKLFQFKEHRKPDFLVVVGKEFVYYGPAIKIGYYLERTISEEARQLSFKKEVTRETSPNTLQALGLLKKIPLEKAHLLEKILLKADKRWKK